MTRAALRLAILTAAVCCVTMPARVIGQPSSCNRACLERAIDGYLDALVERQPARLQLAPSAKFTENGQRLEVGDGVWRTILALVNANQPRTMR